MSLMNKIKAGAEQAGKFAEQAAAKAKEEARELQVKRELGQEEGELGRKVFTLVDHGAVAHPELDEHIARIRELKAELEQLAGPGDEPADDQDADEPHAAEQDAAEPASATPTKERPRSNVPPAMPS
jgi:hypothetical protein